MLKIKSFTVAIASLLLCGNAFAQEGGHEQDNTAPKECVVYMLDYTRSMVGYGFYKDDDGKSHKNEPIFDDVKNMMKQDIKNIPNARTLVHIIKHNDIIGYEKYTAISDAEGKKKLLNHIDEIELDSNKVISNNNTFQALQQVMKNELSPDMYNYIKVMTDGRTYNKGREVDVQKYMLENWNLKAIEKNVYLFYLQLTEAATFAEKTISTQLNKDAKRFHFVNNLESIMAVRLVTPRDSVVEFNVIENKSLKVNFNVALGDCKIADGFKVHCVANASFGDASFNINEDVLLKEYGNGYYVELTPEMSEFIQHKFDSCGYDGCIDLRFAPAGDNNKKFQYTIVSDDVTKITLKNEVQTLSLSTTSAVVNLREGDSEIVLQFKCDKGSIKPGYKVKYSLEYTGKFKNDQGLQKYFKIEERTAEIDKDLKVRIKPAVDPTAKRDAKLMNLKNPIECAVIRLEPVPGMENDYKNVEFKNAECVISLENKTHRTVKINYVK